GTLLVPSPHAAESEWKNPLWLVAETAAGLARGLPGGWAGLGLGLAVASAGMLSFARQSPTLLALMVFPALLTAAVVVGLGHNLWPRFFFFSAGVAVLIAVRGTFTLAARLLPRRGPTVATGLLVLGAMVSATTLPRAWGPKQDYVGAARYIADHARPDDTVFTVDLTDYPLNQYLGHSWPRLEELPALEAAERGQGRTWVVYTFPIRLAAVEPEIWARLESTYDTAAVFRGTVGGGDLVVMVHDPPREPS
ncbi:MAG: hypothetical protein OEW72_08810, partial [Gammaproteobacteria bacterium]|nr:hypothetical protein [Gammaproteobacteria bacterium]